MDKVRRASEMLLQRYPDLFTDNFQTNKEALEKVAIVRTKFLRNQIVGYITRLKSFKEPEEAEVEASTA